MDKSFRLGASIDMACINGNHTMIGSAANPFAGTIDGQSRSISNWTHVSPGTDNIGFISRTTSSGGALIRDLSLLDAVIEGRNQVGILAGAAQFASVHRVRTSGSVTGNDSVGGIVGLSPWGLYESSSSATVTGNGSVGGLVGTTSHFPIASSSFSGAVFASAANAGGLAGNAGGPIVNSYNTGSVTSQANRVGGLAGFGAGWIENSYSTGTVSGTTMVGGLMGEISTNLSYVRNSFSTGSVTGTGGSAANVGVLVGANPGATMNSYYLSTASCDADAATAGVQPCNLIASGSHASLNDFYSVANPPLSSWDFQSTSADGTDDFWEAQAGAFPVAWYLHPQPFTSPFTGAGTASSPYLISSVAEFNRIGSNPRLMRSHFRLTTNLDFGGGSFSQIADSGALFMGNFDGDGFALQNLTQAKGSDGAGLFGYSAQARIRNLIVTGADFSSSRVFAGALAGLFHGTIENCHSSGQVVSTFYTGGLVGFNFGLIERSSSSADLPTTSSAATGGLVGTNYGTIRRSQASGSVVGAAGTGGLVGQSYGLIEDSFSTSPVSFTAGGFPQAYGGLVGFLRGAGQIRNSYATGNITGRSQTGGLVGRREAATTVENCFATGDVTSNSNAANVGLLIGLHAGTLTNSYFLATAYCDANTGTAGIQLCNTTATGTAATLADFFNPATPPMDLWDFDEVWSSDGLSLPSLQ
jgi:hypothetical protein